MNKLLSAIIIMAVLLTPTATCLMDAALAEGPIHLQEIEPGYSIDLNSDGHTDTITWEGRSPQLCVNDDCIFLQYNSNGDISFEDRYVYLGDIDAGDAYIEIFLQDTAYGDFAHPEISVLR